jgi:hypothetical protein
MRLVLAGVAARVMEAPLEELVGQYLNADSVLARVDFSSSPSTALES